MISPHESRAPIRAPRGSQRSCRGWEQEAALRMLMNNLDGEVAEKPDELIVYGGTGKAARNWDCYEKIVSSLKKLENDETLLVQSGKAVGIVRTHEDAPRVLISNSVLVPRWATWEKFHELEALGLTMFGQMTAGSWIYIGTQGIVQGTYETFAAAGAKHFTGNLEGKWILSAGLGGMGGAQPLAATLNGAHFIGVEVDPQRMKRRMDLGYLDTCTTNLEEALKIISKSTRPISVGIQGNAADIYPQCAAKGVIPDMVTDQTSAHDTLNGYIPLGLTVEEAQKLRTRNPQEYVRRALDSIAIHVKAMLELHKRGAVVFDYGNNIRAQALKAGVSNAFDFPGFVSAYIRPMFCEGKGPFRWVALSGEKEDILTTDEVLMEAFPENRQMQRWLRLAREKVPFQGLPGRICWLGYGDRARAGDLFNHLVQSGKVKGPIVIGRDHLDAGSVASPTRETEGMLDGSDAIGDWPVLNALVNTASGASWVSFHHGGGVGIGYSLHAGMVVVADGSQRAARKLERVLTNDPALGVMRHADAGYEKAINFARAKGIKIPHLDSGGTEEPSPFTPLPQAGEGKN